VRLQRKKPEQQQCRLQCIIRLRLVMAKLGRRFWWIPQKVETGGFLFGEN
jgi:hypothetical protein